MTLTATEIAQINKMNEASRRASMGTVIAANESAVAQTAASMGVHVVTAGEATATTLNITTTYTAATGFIVQIYRSGVNVLEDGVVSLASGVLTVANGAATLVLAENDVIHYILI